MKRDIVTQVSYTTVTVANAVVWVDENGVAFKTEPVNSVTALPASPSKSSPDDTTSLRTYIKAPASISAPDSKIASPETTFPAVLVNPLRTGEWIAYDGGAASPTFTSVVTSSSPSSVGLYTGPEAVKNATSIPPPSSGPGLQKPADQPFPIGVAWDAFYRNENGDTLCKDDAMIRDEFSRMSEFGLVRLYGSGCDQVSRVLPNALRNGQKLMLGIYAPIEKIEDSARMFADAINRHAGGEWDSIVLITMENEKINSHEMTVSQVVDLMGQTRNALARVGYHGPIGAVETVPAMIGNPQLCQSSDLALVNIHAFFDGKVLPQDAGNFVLNEFRRVQQACPNRRVVVTESGWPYQGIPNDQAVPSRENQRIAMDSIRKVFDSDMVLFSPFNSNWKTDEPATFGAEKYWGFGGY
jgi:exo-beta-1,3-glucanase (GH17 family)